MIEKIVTHLIFVTNYPGVFSVSRVEDIVHYLMGYAHLSESMAVELVAKFNLELNKVVQREVRKKYSMKLKYDWHRLIRLESADDRQTLKLLNEYLHMIKIVHQPS